MIASNQHTDWDEDERTIWSAYVSEYGGQAVAEGDEVDLAYDDDPQAEDDETPLEYHEEALQEIRQHL